MVLLKGMTWDHPRGYDPLVAATNLYAGTRQRIAIEWEKRSLQDFEHYPVADLAARYDLIIIDHPHVGEMADVGALLPLDRPERAEALAEIAAGTVGPSFVSYNWQGRQWALPVDAAAQVQAYRPDRLGAPLRTWSEVVDLAREGNVVLPLRPPHALMCIMTLAANLGHFPGVGGTFLPEDVLKAILNKIEEVSRHLPAECRSMDPITASELLATSDRFVVAPLLYGYVSYARPGFRESQLAFADIPALGDAGPRGSVLGGTGLAVSARCQNAEAAIDFAYFIAGSAVQRGIYAASGGQPAHRDAWLDEAVNTATGNFHRATLATLERAYLRPRHKGYIYFQLQASGVIADFLDDRISLSHAAKSLEDAFIISKPDHRDAGQ